MVYVSLEVVAWTVWFAGLLILGLLMLIASVFTADTNRQVRELDTKARLQLTGRRAE